jgi:hypothetical protein
MQSKIDSIMKKYAGGQNMEYGYAHLYGLLSGEYSSWQWGVSIIRKLDGSIIDSIGNGPTARYRAHYDEVNRELNSVVAAISDELGKSGIKSLPVEATVDDSMLDDDYFKTLRYTFSHKLVATRAGLGWIGKTDLLITRSFGPRVRLASYWWNIPCHRWKALMTGASAATELFALMPALAVQLKTYCGTPALTAMFSSIPSNAETTAGRYQRKC